ncbi:MAG TPA: 2-C-methyl-D-erythritol 4-phosphate cytidylyltransferase [Ignavibacteria bacterium]|nr:2-C-methyl-D-erythritol 4-phosphate cytidylyltransferase [Ignavibacteria bacterium]
MKHFVIIPASGSGSRFGGKTPKQFLKLPPHSKEVLYYTIKKFHDLKIIDEIIISTNPSYFNKIKKIISDNNFNKIKKIVAGGETRQISVYNALYILKNCDSSDKIIVHDAVRPFISKNKILELIRLSHKFKSLVPALKINDTLKNVDKNGYISDTVNRENIWRIQTPQIFNYSEIFKCMTKAIKNNFDGTDESSVVSEFGSKVKITEGEVTNIKITTKDDLKRVDFNKLLIS